MGADLVPGTSQLQNAAGQFFSKTITFTGASGAGAVGTVAVGTVAGGVIAVTDVVGRVTTSLTGATATLALGTASQTAALIAATTATTMTTTNNLWVSTTATAGAILVPAALFQGLYTVESLILTVATAAVASGVLEIDMIWHPLTAGATLT